MATVQERGALYYPYIYIRDINWLKTTLLCFPQVRRMIPTDDFRYHDNLEMMEFLCAEGRNGRLLVDQYLTTNAVISAQLRLLEKLKAHEAFVAKTFSLRAISRGLFREDKFAIHAGKFSGELLSYLKHNSLARWTRPPNPEMYVNLDDPIDWYEVHPRLGEAFMSVVAIALARDFGLDIVTDSGWIHAALANLDEEAVLNSLVQPYTVRPRQAANRVTELTDELTQIVLTIGFDVSKLSAKQVIDLSKDGKALHAFKAKLAEAAEQLPDIENTEERVRLLRKIARNVVEEWADSSSDLKRFAKETTATGVEKKLPSQLEKIASDLAPSLAGSVASASFGATVTTTLLGAAAGLGVGLITYAGLALIRRHSEHKSDPYRYLTSLNQAGASVLLTSSTAAKGT